MLAGQLESFYHKTLQSLRGRASQVLATPLNSAMCNGQLATAKLLIKRGAAPLTQDDDGHYVGSSALFLAARLGLVELLESMLETSNIEITDLKDANGLTPLYHACAGQCWHSTVPFLLKQGANIDHTFTTENRSFQISTTMLGEACYMGKFRTALRLLDLGAGITVGVDVTLHDIGQLAAAQYIRHQDQSGDRPHGHLPLLHACCHKPEKIQDPNFAAAVKRLVKAGAALEEKWGGETALGFAARRCVQPAVRALLDAGADVDSCDTAGRTPLMAAIVEKVYEQGVGGGNTAGLHFLPRHPGIFPERPPTEFHQGCRPLLPVVKRLLDAKASLTMRDRDGRTALHLFFSQLPTPLVQGSEHIVRLLLRNGADPCARDSKNTSVFVAAFNYNTLSICNVMLRVHYDKITQCLNPCDLRTMIKRVMCQSDARNHVPNFTPSYVQSDDHSKLGAQVTGINLVLDLDHTRCISSDKQFFLDLFCAPAGQPLNRNPVSARSFDEVVSEQPVSDVFRINMAAANAIFQLGVEGMGLDTDDWTVILCGLLFSRSKHTTYDFLLTAFKYADLNQLDKKGMTFLYELMFSPTRFLGMCRRFDPDESYHSPPDITSAMIIISLIDSGANVHLPQQKPPSKSGWVAPSDFLETPVWLAIEQALTADSRKDPDYLRVLEYMLQKQPIRGNPDAARVHYLHIVVHRLLPMFTPMAPIVQMLLDAGADPTELNKAGDSPLSVLMQSMTDARQNESDFVKDEPWVSDTLAMDFFRTAMMLSADPGVDINHKNNDGLSVADYLEELMEKLAVEEYVESEGTPCIDEDGDETVEFTAEVVTKLVEDRVMRRIRSCLELVDVPGQEGRKMIRWLK